MAERKAAAPLTGKASANAKQVKLETAEPPAPEPRRRERTIDGVKYVLVNGGWQRAERE